MRRRSEEPDPHLPASGAARVTELYGFGGQPGPAPTVGRFLLRVLEGGEASSGWESSGAACSIGSDAGNDLRLMVPTVSRFHCEIRVEDGRVGIVDLGSRNGTVVDGVTVKEAFLKSGSLIRLGTAVLRFELADGGNRLLLSSSASFGGLHGASVPMRACFALMERAACSDATVLLEGETGTGKGQAAEAIHQASGRRDGPFVLVDCGAIPANLLESELFGHEKGSFTGADTRRKGAFEEAAGGTIFLDEIGELPLALQPKLLRAIEKKQIRLVGTNLYRPIDVRIVAATNRDLRTEVNAGRFRSDLFFRLSVVRIVLPPLRQRAEDFPELVRALLLQLGADQSRLDRFCQADFLAGLARSAWPGNVRELRNHLERGLVFEEPLPLGEGASMAEPTGGVAIDAALPYAEARSQALDAFTRAYVQALLDRHGGRVAAAARAAGIDRVYLYRLMRRHGVVAPTTGRDADEGDPGRP